MFVGRVQKVREVGGQNVPLKLSGANDKQKLYLTHKIANEASETHKAENRRTCYFLSSKMRIAAML